MSRINRICAALCAVLPLANSYMIGRIVVHKYQTRPPSRPTVCDRTGRILLTDRRKSLFSMPVRQAEYGGRFASSLLGHTIIGDGGRIGALGMESLIDKNGLEAQSELFLTMDAGIQEKCEALLDRITAIRTPCYTYITVLDSDGNLIAAASVPPWTSTTGAESIVRI